AGAAPDRVDPRQVRVAQLTDDMNGPALLGGSNLVVAGQELEGHGCAIGGLGLPNLAEVAAAQEAAQSIAWARLTIDFQWRGTFHGLSSGFARRPKQLADRSSWDTDEKQ